MNEAQDQVVLDKPILSAYSIRVQVGKKLLLDEVSLELEKGKVIALLGPNGSGKSTLMKVMSGIYGMDRQSGQVRYLSHDLFKMPQFERAQKVVYLSPEVRTEFPMTAQELVRLGRGCYRSSWGLSNPVAVSEDEAVVRKAMEDTLCWELRARLLDSLSDGERQLVSLARALAQGAPVLFLDETLSKMDLHHQAAMGKLLRRLASQGKTILLVSHDINLAAEWADSIVFLKNGKKEFEGETRAILTLENLQRIYPGTTFALGTHPITGMPKVFFA